VPLESKALILPIHRGICFGGAKDGVQQLGIILNKVEKIPCAVQELVLFTCERFLIDDAKKMPFKTLWGNSALPK
jgi:hypothetical protein